MDAAHDLVRSRLPPAAQRRLLRIVAQRLIDAPLYAPLTPSGRMSVRQSNFGRLGWVCDASGYRYADAHPVTGRPWPAIPRLLIRLWRRIDPSAPLPDSCLVNYYASDAKMGLHRDLDEADFSAPIVSVSLGDEAVFRLGGLKRADRAEKVRLQSGDVIVLAGARRLAFHGIDRILAHSSPLLPGGGRINLTLRRAGPVAG